LFEVLDLLPHPRLKSEMTNSNPNTLAPTMLLLPSSFRLRVVNRVPNKPKPGSSSPKRGAWYPLLGGVEAADIVNVEDAALEPGEMVEGLREQVNPAGAEQVSVI